MSSLLVISQKALRKLGVKEINSLTQQGRAADRCNSAVRDAVKEVLRAHAWSHATVWASLPQLVADPPFGYQYAYQAPQECEKVFDVRQDTDLTTPRIDFEMVRGKIIYTDADPCYARYVVNVESDLAKAPSDFINSCAFNLAAEIAIPLSKSNLATPMSNGYMITLSDAVKNDTQAGRERKVDENQDCKLLAARGYPSASDAEAY
jgi:hypothetical protein